MLMFGAAFGPDDEVAPRQKLLLDAVENLDREPIRQDEFDRAIAASGEELAGLARQALADHRAGRTQKLDSDTL